MTTDGDTESVVKENLIRSQKFNVGDVVEVNCAGKGRWYRARVITIYAGGEEYDIKYSHDDIKWVTNAAVKGNGEVNR